MTITLKELIDIHQNKPWCITSVEAKPDSKNKQAYTYFVNLRLQGLNFKAQLELLEGQKGEDFRKNFAKELVFYSKKEDNTIIYKLNSYMQNILSTH